MKPNSYQDRQTDSWTEIYLETCVDSNFFMPLALRKRGFLEEITRKLSTTYVLMDG